MPSPQEYADVRHVLDEYIEASYTGNVPSLKTVFHPDALMSGYLINELDIGTPEPFYVELTETPSAKETGEPYQAEIVFIHINGPLASAAIVEERLLGMNYINHFHLLKIEGEWRIISKIYTSVD
jgi:hypothetical protein